MDTALIGAAVIPVMVGAMVIGVAIAAFIATLGIPGHGMVMSADGNSADAYWIKQLLQNLFYLFEIALAHYHTR